MNSGLLDDRALVLLGEVRRFMRLRWVVGLTLVLGGLFNGLVLRWYPAGATPVLLGTGLIAYNIVLCLEARRWGKQGPRARTLRIFAALQLHLDIVCACWLAAVTGGVASPFLGFSILLMVFAALIHPGYWAYASAGFAIITMGAALWATDQWPKGEYAWQLGVGWGATMVVTVFLVDRVSRAMYRHEAVRRAEIRRVNVMSEQLKEHQRALIQGEKLAAMGRLAAGIAHEITNPLASMDSVLQLMERKGGDATIRSTTLASLREQIHRIYRTIRQLTTFAHPGSGEVESTSVNSIVHASLELLALNHSLPRIDVRQELSPDAGSARVNAHAIQQVLTNLLANALDAVAEREDARIAVRTSRRDGWCVIEVVDNGSGIAPEHLAKVFDPFFTTKPVGKGTGLGLSISLSLVREQGGELSVVSEQSAPLGGGTGGGTVFTLKLRSEATVGETSEPPLAEIQPAR